METKDLHIAPVSELADRTHKKTTAFLWNAAVYHCGEGGIVLASAAHSLAARRGALATGLKRLICSKHIMAFFTRVLASERADTCKKNDRIPLECSRLPLRRGRDSNPRSLSAQQFSRLP